MNLSDFFGNRRKKEAGYDSPFGGDQPIFGQPDSMQNVPRTGGVDPMPPMTGGPDPAVEPGFGYLPPPTEAPTTAFATNASFGQPAPANTQQLTGVNGQSTSYAAPPPPSGDYGGGEAPTPAMVAGPMEYDFITGKMKPKRAY